VWDKTTGEVLWRREMDGLANLTALAFNSGGTRLFTGDTSGSIHILVGSSGREILRQVGQGSVASIQTGEPFHPVRIVRAFSRGRKQVSLMGNPKGRIPPGNTIDLLKPCLDPEFLVGRNGKWVSIGGFLQNEPATSSSLEFPFRIKAGFEFRMTFEKVGTGNGFQVRLPIAGTQVVVAVDSIQNEKTYHGLARVDNLHMGATTVKTLSTSPTTGNRELQVEVSYEGDDVHIKASVDGKGIVDWKGHPSRLSHALFFPRKDTLGLATSKDGIRINSANLTVLEGYVERLR